MVSIGEKLMKTVKISNNKSLLLRYNIRERKVMYYIDNLYYAFVFILIWIFTPVSRLIDQYVVYLVPNENMQHGLSRVYLAIALIITAIITWKAFYKAIHNRYYLPLKYCMLLLAIGLIYWSNRFCDSYEFFPLMAGGELNGAKLLDLPFTIYTCFLVLLLFNSLFEYKDRKTYLNVITADMPLNTIEEDEFGRKKLYESFIDLIKENATYTSSLSIGVVNRWGEGKTSFLKFLREDLKTDNNTIVIEFNPWYSTNSDNLTIDFFQSLDQVISEYVYTGDMIRKYAKNLTNINSVFNPFKYIPEIWIGDKPNRQYFESVNNLIKRLDKRIIVIIDDMDRLDHKEVFSVFQVIRNSGAFCNTMFITPIDKEYVIKSLAESKIPNPEDYIKKMFDVEISLPAISKAQLVNSFHRHLKTNLKSLEKLTDEDEKKFCDQIEKILSDSTLKHFSVSKYSTINKFFFAHLRNKRDLIRYTNALVFSLKSAHQIVYLPDMLLLELIKYLNVDVYMKLFENTHYLTQRNEDGGFVTKNFLYSIVEQSNSEELLKRELSETINNFDIRFVGNDRVDVADLIDQLFNEPIQNEFRGEYSMHYAKNYSVYHRLVQDGITREEIDDLFR